MGSIPFTTEQFFQVLADYNLGVWPAQILIYALAIMTVAAQFLRLKNPLRWQAISLATLWFWTGIIYHIGYFTTIDNAAWGFGVLFIIQGILLIVAGINRSRFTQSSNRDGRSMIGWIFTLFAMILYPLLSPVFGHPWPAMPSFGLPCPLTIFTFGVMLWWSGRRIVLLGIIPLIWALIGTSAAFNFGVWQDLSLPVAGILGFVLLFGRRKVKDAELASSGSAESPESEAESDTDSLSS
jgi:hypothetical protein